MRPSRRGLGLQAVVVGLVMAGVVALAASILGHSGQAIVGFAIFMGLTGVPAAYFAMGRQERKDSAVMERGLVDRVDSSVEARAYRGPGSINWRVAGGVLVVLLIGFGLVLFGVGDSHPEDPPRDLVFPLPETAALVTERVYDSSDGGRSLEITVEPRGGTTPVELMGELVDYYTVRGWEFPVGARSPSAMGAACPRPDRTGYVLDVGLGFDSDSVRLVLRPYDGDRDGTAC